MHAFCNSLVPGSIYDKGDIKNNVDNLTVLLSLLESFQGSFLGLADVYTKHDHHSRT